MTLNKKILAAAIVGLLIPVSASAIQLGNPSRNYAIEHNKPLVITDAADNVTFPLNYNFSAGEVRHGRYECTANLTINSPTVTSGTPASISVGAVNGAGTPARQPRTRTGATARARTAGTFRARAGSRPNCR